MPSAARMAVLFCIVCGLYGWALFVMSFRHDGLIGPRFYAPGTDWMVYYAGVKALLAKNLPLIFDAERFTAYQNEMFAAWLSKPLPFRPWLYPPDYLLFLLPFAALPFTFSYFLFQGTSFTAAALATSWHKNRGFHWCQAIALLLSPAACVTVIAGQNAFLSAALMIGGFRLLPRRPVLGGILLGMLTYKPQLWVLVPIALIAARNWRSLVAAGATALLLMAASVALMGIEPWRLWLDQAMNASGAFYAHWLEFGLLHGFSPYVCAILLGASAAVATVIQLVAFLAACGAVYGVYRRPFAADLQLATLLAATMLVAPHVQSYDMVLLAAAAMLVFTRAREGGFLPGEIALLGTIWVLPLMQPIVVPIARAAPLIIALFVAYILVRGARSLTTEADRSGHAPIAGKALSPLGASSPRR